MESVEQRKLLSALAHGSALFSSTFICIGVPIVILMISEDPVVKANAKEVLNLYLSLYIYAFFSLILFFLLIGFPLLILVCIASFVLPIIALVKVLSNPDRPYQYPLVIHIL